MNFLQLCQRVASECSVNLTGPSSVENQTGRLGQIVKWTNAGWMDLQTKHDDWKFMRSSFSVNTTTSDGKYVYGDCTDVSAAVPIDAFRKWVLNTFKVYQTAAGVGTQTDLHFIGYDCWNRRWNTGAQTDSYPGEFTVDHDHGILLAPKPDGIYTVTGEYMKSATEMAADDDEPGLPEEFHMAIVYRAMMKYGRYNGAPEVFSDGQAEYRRMLREMSRTQRPEHLVGGALA